MGEEPSAHRASAPATAQSVSLQSHPHPGGCWQQGPEPCWRVTQSQPAGTAPSEFVHKPAQVEAKLFPMDVTPQAQPCPGCRITTPRAGQQHSPDPAPVPGPNPGEILQEQSTPSPSGCKWGLSMPSQGHPGLRREAQEMGDRLLLTHQGSQPNIRLSGKIPNSSNHFRLAVAVNLLPGLGDEKSILAKHSRSICFVFQK